MHVVLINIHGCVRAQNLELGRDTDTGGQTKYVIELARALSRSPKVTRVDVLTRRIDDPALDSSYAQCSEPIEGCATLTRIDAGPAGYLQKEQLWPHLDEFTRNALAFLRSLPTRPVLLHAHYADSGLVTATLSKELGVPMAFTAHSLGRVKLNRLLNLNYSHEAIDKEFNITTRIRAEDTALEQVSFVIASTEQEKFQQYREYENCSQASIELIPPGVALELFRPPTRPGSEACPAVDRFLRDPTRPQVLVVSRADERKNIARLVRVFGRNRRLRDVANLILILGSRETLDTLDRGCREVIQEILFLIDDYDLYGITAYPKSHSPEDVPSFYRAATASRGVFVNIALHEPFGFTLIEAAASGLPVLATTSGGPSEILKRLDNGILVDPQDDDAIAAGLERLLLEEQLWQRSSQQGLDRVAGHYSWDAHTESYLGVIERRCLS